MGAVPINENKRPNCVLNMTNSCLDNGVHLNSWKILSKEGFRKGHWYEF